MAVAGVDGVAVVHPDEIRAGRQVRAGHQLARGPGVRRRPEGPSLEGLPVRSSSTRRSLLRGSGLVVKALTFFNTESTENHGAHGGQEQMAVPDLYFYFWL